MIILMQVHNDGSKYIGIAVQLIFRANQYKKNVEGIKYSFNKLAITKKEFMHHLISPGGKEPV